MRSKVERHSEEAEKAVRDLPAGEHKLGGELKFQECNDQICKLPQTVRFEIPLTIQPIKE